MELVHNDTKGPFEDRFEASEGYVNAWFTGSFPDVTEGLMLLRLSYGLIRL